MIYTLILQVAELEVPDGRPSSFTSQIPEHYVISLLRSSTSSRKKTGSFSMFPSTHRAPHLIKRRINTVCKAGQMMFGMGLFSTLGRSSTLQHPLAAHHSVISRRTSSEATKYAQPSFLYQSSPRYAAYFLRDCIQGILCPLRFSYHKHCLSSQTSYGMLSL